MRQVPGWNEYFMQLAFAASARSKDPNTQVGAVITDRDHRIISIGYNGFADKAQETPGLWHDDCKDQHVIHAEVNAIANAARAGVSTQKSVMYITLPPCLPCARIVAAAGVSCVGFPKQTYREWVERKPVWEYRFAQALSYLNEAGMTWFMIDGIFHPPVPQVLGDR